MSKTPVGPALALSHRSVLTLALPIMLSNVSTPLLGAVDTAVVGQIPDPAYIGAVALGSLVFTFVFWAFGFLRMGTTGLTAQALGAGDTEGVANCLGREPGGTHAQESEGPEHEGEDQRAKRHSTNVGRVRDLPDHGSVDRAEQWRGDVREHDRQCKRKHAAVADRQCRANRCFPHVNAFTIGDPYTGLSAHERPVHSRCCVCGR